MPAIQPIISIETNHEIHNHFPGSSLPMRTNHHKKPVQLENTHLEIRCPPPATPAAPVTASGPLQPIQKQLNAQQQNASQLAAGGKWIMVNFISYRLILEQDIH